MLHIYTMHLEQFSPQEHVCTCIVYGIPTYMYTKLKKVQYAKHILGEESTMFTGIST